ncbi:MAG: cysteine biosynthesis protein [Desulfotalea sp.]|nr:MAG: cysteine biosynthesis protein [Desulfotalea sp.]
MQKQHRLPTGPRAKWQPLSRSLWLILSRKRLLAWSSLLVLLTILFTWIGYQFAIDFLDELGGQFMTAPPDSGTIIGWITTQAYSAGSWMYHLVSKILAFYLAFLLAYSLTTPGYAFLSHSAEKLHAGEDFDPDAKFCFTGVCIDILEGLKIAFLGILVTIVALFVNFIPGIGQVTVFILYTYYSALMFVDYPASRRRWGLRRKIAWLYRHRIPCFRIGVLPAVISMIPIINIFAIALLFPVLTVHATLNFSAIELANKRYNNGHTGDPHGT